MEGLPWLNALAGEEKSYCLDILLDLHKFGREHEWRGTVVNFGINIGTGLKTARRLIDWGELC